MKKFLAVMIVGAMLIALGGCGNSDSVVTAPAGGVYVMNDSSAYDMYLTWGVDMSPLAFVIANTSEEDVVVKKVVVNFDTTNSTLFAETVRWFELREDSSQETYDAVTAATVVPGSITVEMNGISIIPKKSMKRFVFVTEIWGPANQTQTMSWRAFVAPGSVKAFGLTTGREMKVDGGVSGGIIRMDNGGKG